MVKTILRSKRGFGTGIVLWFAKNSVSLPNIERHKKMRISSAAYQTTQHLITGNCVSSSRGQLAETFLVNTNIREMIIVSSIRMKTIQHPSWACMCLWNRYVNLSWVQSLHGNLQQNVHLFWIFRRKHFSIWFVLRIASTEDLDIAFEYRLLTQKTVQDLLDGYNAEVGMSWQKNLRLSVGYNFKGYRERDLVDCTLWSSGPYVQLDFKFTEEILKLWNSKWWL